MLNRRHSSGREDAKYDRMMEKNWAAAAKQELDLQLELEQVLEQKLENTWTAATELELDQELENSWAAAAKQQLEFEQELDQELDHHYPTYEEDEMNTSLWYPVNEEAARAVLKPWDNNSQQSLLFAMFLCLLYIGILHFTVIMYALFVR